MRLPFVVRRVVSQKGCSRASMFPMQCSVSGRVGLNATLRIIYAFGVLRAIGVVFSSERRKRRGSGVVCPPEGQAPRQFERKNERDCSLWLGG